MVGNASGGTAYLSITAEEAPAAGTIKVWCTILEDHEIAVGAWGGYSGMEMMWLPVAFPLGTAGSVLNFTGPYPQTISVQGNYTLNPSTHIFNNLNVAAFVQYTAGTKEVLNAYYDDLPDTATGVYDAGTAPVDGNAVLGAWPNPSTGNFSVSSFVPQGATGTVDIFDVSGRLVSQFEAGAIHPVTVTSAGIYYIRLNTSTGETVRQQVAVIR